MILVEFLISAPVQCPKPSALPDHMTEINEPGGYSRY
jgi:hypothetical protein